MRDIFQFEDFKFNLQFLKPTIRGRQVCHFRYIHLFYILSTDSLSCRKIA